MDEHMFMEVMTIFKKIKIIATRQLLLFLGLWLSLSSKCLAQYMPGKKTNNLSEDFLLKYTANFIEIVSILIIIYTIFILFIAIILYATAGNDEDRADVARMWTKHSIFSMVIAIIMYAGVNIIE